MTTMIEGLPHGSVIDTSPRTEWAVVQSVTVTDSGFVRTEDDTHIILITSDLLNAMAEANKSSDRAIIPYVRQYE